MRRRGTPAAQSDSPAPPARVIQITAITRDNKALRGTKRVCQACAARFYDLSRERIVCPSCGANYVPQAVPAAAEAGAQGARYTDKTSWRSRSFRHAEPDSTPEEGTPTEDGHEEPLAPAANDDIVLEEETDEADISGLVEHHETDPKER
jgi:uncharacterized protein (TIGR02300 family)